MSWQHPITLCHSTVIAGFGYAPAKTSIQCACIATLKSRHCMKKVMVNELAQRLEQGLATYGP